MSSNRALGGARQRRAGEQAPMVGQRSNTSISSQQIFAKQQIQSQQSSNQRVQRQPQSQIQQPQTQNFIQENIEQVVPGKLSIPKAFTLVTLRLGRLEQYIQQIQEEGGLTQYADTTSENNQVFDSVIKNVLTRLDELEKNLKQINSLKDKDNIKEEDKNLIDLKNNVNKLDKDLRETKDLVMLLMMKHEKFTLETNDKIQNLNDILDQMNSSFQEMDENEEEYVSENVNIVIENDENNINFQVNESENIAAINLKEIIENELSNELLGENSC